MLGVLLPITVMLVVWWSHNQDDIWPESLLSIPSVKKLSSARKPEPLIFELREVKTGQESIELGAIQLDGALSIARLWELEASTLKHFVVDNRSTAIIEEDLRTVFSFVVKDKEMSRDKGLGEVLPHKA